MSVDQPPDPNELVSKPSLNRVDPPFVDGGLVGIGVAVGWTGAVGTAVGIRVEVAVGTAVDVGTAVGAVVGIGVAGVWPGIGSTTWTESMTAMPAFAPHPPGPK